MRNELCSYYAIQTRLSEYAQYHSLQRPDFALYFTTPLHQVPVGKYLLDVWHICPHMNENELTEHSMTASLARGLPAMTRFPLKHIHTHTRSVTHSAEVNKRMRIRHYGNTAAQLRAKLA